MLSGVEARSTKHDLFLDLKLCYTILMPMIPSDDTHDEQMAWARSIQNARHVLFEPWRGLFKALGRAPEYQAIQTDAAENLYGAGLDLCRRLGRQVTFLLQPCRECLIRRRLEFTFSHNGASAVVPAQDRVVISRRTE